MTQVFTKNTWFTECLRTIIVMENDRPDHPQILLLGLPLSLADYPYNNLVLLDIPAADNQPDQFIIKWSQQFTHRLEPAAQCAFGKTDTQMAELLDLPVEWNVIFVFLQEHFGQHGGTSQTFVSRRRWKRSNDYAAFTFPGKTQVVFQPILGTDSLFYMQPARFKFQRTGTFLADPSVTVQIQPVRFNHHFNYRQSLQEFAVTPGFLLLSIGLCF